MIPISECVVKISARCNINCDYCYEFNLGDETWRQKPARMSIDVSRQLRRRVEDHVAEHQLSVFRLGLHGGEPLLVGAEHFDRILVSLKTPILREVPLEFSVQSNATLVTPEFCEILRHHGVSVGVSVDGPQAVNDFHRVDHRGRSTYDATMRGIEMLKELCPQQLDGLLAVLDVRSDPIQLLDFFGSLGVPDIDILLPDHDWNRPPERPGGSATAYADWWYALWSAWIGGRQPHLRIRFLEHIVRKLVGGRGRGEAMTLEPVSLAVVGTDGSIEALDALKSNAAGTQTLGLNIDRHTLDDAAGHPAMRARQVGIFGLSKTCQQCSRVRVCGGGYLPHRWKSVTGYRNPSVYCSDLFDLIGRMAADIGSVPCELV